jgi:hypothetical protein
MKNSILIFLLMSSLITKQCCSDEKSPTKGDVNILFLHHSVGQCIWQGKHNLIGKIFKKFKHSALKEAINNYCKKNGKNYIIKEQVFPKESPYGWNNYPFDYYNIWVKHAGNKPYMEEPTLEMLSQQYQVIIWKHCYPVSNMQQDTSPPNIDSSIKKIENYKLQYLALRDKMHDFPNTKFIIWTGAAQVESQTNEQEAKMAKEFFNWVKNEWDIEGDNIYLWDFRQLETEDSLYLLKKYARNRNDPHPNELFSEKAAMLLSNRIIDVIENDGKRTNLKGDYIK